MNKEVKYCQGKDVFERMNYLYQAGQSLVKKNLPLASHYNSLMIGCAKKAVLRMEPDIKRTMCKSCHSPLVPGKTARVRLISKPVKAVKWICLACGNSKKIPTKKGYKLWWDQPEAVRCVLDYTPKPRIESLKPPIESSESTAKKENKMEVDPVVIVKEKELLDKSASNLSK